jgi:hypothetical protein
MPLLQSYVDAINPSSRQKVTLQVALKAAMMATDLGEEPFDASSVLDAALDSVRALTEQYSATYPWSTRAPGCPTQPPAGPDASRASPTVGNLGTTHPPRSPAQPLAHPDVNSASPFVGKSESPAEALAADTIEGCVMMGMEGCMTTECNSGDYLPLAFSSIQAASGQRGEGRTRDTEVLMDAATMRQQTCAGAEPKPGSELRGMCKNAEPGHPEGTTTVGSGPGEAQEHAVSEMVQRVVGLVGGTVARLRRCDAWQLSSFVASTHGDDEVCSCSAGHESS